MKRFRIAIIGTATVIAVFAYGTGLIEEASNDLNYFYGLDGLGSVIGLTDGGTGKAATTYAYDPWGNATSNGTVGLKNKFRFTGEALDRGTGLYYLRARYYDPAQARFISKDLFTGNISVSLSHNRFTYSLNRPTNLIDPTGFAAEAPAANTLLPIANTQLFSSNSNSTLAMTLTGSSLYPASIVNSAIETGCNVVGAVQTIFEKTSEFIASGAIKYIYSGGGTQQVSDVPCYSNLPGVGLFFSSVSTAH